jgi:alkanesulfonate monooxygenase SsuD/methylene tetrahydromethanopterin reductase-like flavin-dependent oxidoreductase (luciferase family)
MPITVDALVPHGWKYDVPRGVNGPEQWRQIKQVALEVERLGFDGGWFYDHMVRFPEKIGESTFEGWTVATAVAAVTEKLRIGHICLGNSYRYPSLLAKMAATLDCVSNGRVTLGIGAGYHEVEYKQYGIFFPPPSERISRLREAVKLIKLMLDPSQETPNFKGKYYSIEGAHNFPKPIQRHVPILIAGGGEGFTLRVVAQLADMDNMGVNYTLEQYKQKFELEAKYCDRYSRKPSEIMHTCLREVVIGRNNDEILEKFKKYELEQINPWQSTLATQKRPRITGTPEQCVEQLRKFVDIGVQKFLLYFPDAIELKSLELFADKVTPNLI